MKVSSTFTRLMTLIGLLSIFCEAISEVAPNVHRRVRNSLPSRGSAVQDFVAKDVDSAESNKCELCDDYGHMRFGKRDTYDDYGHMRFGKRDTYDDYGHMRFGKRDAYDDYGHMRFGRSDE